MRIHAVYLLIAMALVLTGCDRDIGIKRDYRDYAFRSPDNSDDFVRLSDDPNALSNVFGVPMTYQEAYRRADAYAQICRTSKSFAKRSWSVRAHLDDDDQTGFVAISESPFGLNLELIEISATGKSTASVKVTVRNFETWDQREMDSARQSIETGKPTCR